MALNPSVLPIIDFTKFIDENASQEDKRIVAQNIDHACQTFGFFYLINHGIPADKLQKAIDLGHSFFQLPLETRKGLSMKSNDFARGYAGIGGEKTNNKRDILESLDLFRPVSPGEFGLTTKFLGGKNVWPTAELPELEIFYEEYIQKVKNLGSQVLDALVMASGLMDVVRAKELTSDPFWILRIIGYPPLNTFDKSPYDENGIPFGTSLGEHTDYGCLTLLNQDPSVRSTLQAQLLDGRWVDADPIPGSFVVNVGDMLSIWTNGRYKSTPHRVIHRGEKYRVSVPFFFEPNFDSVNTSLTGESSDKAVSYGEFLLQKYVDNYGHQAHDN